MAASTPPAPDTSGAGTSGAALPGTLHWGTVLVLAEAAVLAVLAAVLLYADFTATNVDTRMAFAVTGYVVLIAASLALLGVKLRQRRRWARGPAVALQLMLVPMGIYLIKGGQPFVGIPVMALGLTVTWLLVSAPTREALGIR